MATAIGRAPKGADESDLSDVDEEVLVSQNTPSHRNKTTDNADNVESQIKMEPDNPDDVKVENGETEENPLDSVAPAEWSGNVPIFKPTMAQFKDFKKFMETVDSYGMKAGIIKIVPPEEWKQSLPPIENLVKQVRVRDPIKQEIMGSSGTYRQVNFIHGRTYNVPQWRALCDQSEHQPPARRGECRREGSRQTAAAAPSLPSRSRRKPPPKPTTEETYSTTKPRRGRPSRNAPKAPRSPVSPSRTTEEDDDKTNCQDDTVQSIEEAQHDEPQSVSARRKHSRREPSAKIEDEAFRDFDYHMDVSEFTPERCAELERIYWKTLTYASPLYGADLMGTLFDESVDQWNLNKLPNLLDVLGTKVPGVNTAYLYLGMWKATFAWHLEDVDLYSINYLHFGAPKQWYSISQCDARRFEAAMRTIWPQEAKACDQFLRHKGFLISPQHLKSHFNITVNKVLSYPGEFVVTYPYGYHSGYNLGYNCAEAVNFALDTWLPMGKIAKRCECPEAQDSVWVDVYEIERKMRGESSENEFEYVEVEIDEDEEEENDATIHGLPSPSDSSTSAVNSNPSTRKKTNSKRKRQTGIESDASGTVPSKKVRIVKQPKARKSRIEPICCLCPNDIPSLPVLKTTDGRAVHRLCARYVHETFFDVDSEDDSVDIVGGIEEALTNGHDLKCLFCHSKRGAYIGCSQQGCSRVYHATCAAASGAFVEEALVPVFGSDGTEYAEDTVQLSCRFHRVRRDRQVTGYALERSGRGERLGRSLKAGDICQIQLNTKDVWAGVVVENRLDEEMLVLETLPSRETIEVQWKWLVVPAAADYHLPKASATAKSMPRAKKDRSGLFAIPGEGVAPRKDEPFVDGYTWAEFSVHHNLCNPDQKKVDLTRPGSGPWIMLPAYSTEKRAAYTADPAVRVADPNADFMVRVHAGSSARRQPDKQVAPAHLPMQGPASLQAPPMQSRPFIQAAQALPLPHYPPPPVQIQPPMPQYQQPPLKNRPIQPVHYLQPHHQSQSQRQPPQATFIHYPQPRIRTGPPQPLPLPVYPPAPQTSQFLQYVPGPNAPRPLVPSEPRPAIQIPSVSPANRVLPPMGQFNPTPLPRQTVVNHRQASVAKPVGPQAILPPVHTTVSTQRPAKESWRPWTQTHQVLARQTPVPVPTKYLSSPKPLGLNGAPASPLMDTSLGTSLQPVKVSTTPIPPPVIRKVAKSAGPSAVPVTTPVAQNLPNVSSTSNIVPKTVSPAPTATATPVSQPPMKAVMTPKSMSTSSSSTRKSATAVAESNTNPAVVPVSQPCQESVHKTEIAPVMKPARRMTRSAAEPMQKKGVSDEIGLAHVPTDSMGMVNDVLSHLRRLAGEKIQ